MLVTPRVELPLSFTKWETRGREEEGLSKVTQELSGPARGTAHKHPYTVPQTCSDSGD